MSLIGDGKGRERDGKLFSPDDGLSVWEDRTGVWGQTSKGPTVVELSTLTLIQGDSCHSCQLCIVAPPNRTTPPIVSAPPTTAYIHHP